MLEEIKQKLTEFATSVSDSFGFEVVDVKLKKHRQTYMADIAVDKLHGGITIDECTEVNKLLSQCLEEDGLLGESYSVDVSSPGLDRPLKTDKDFKRNVGHAVDFYLSEPVNKKVTWTGTVLDVKGHKVLVKTKNEDIEIPLIIIDKALQVLNYDLKNKKNKVK